MFAYIDETGNTGARLLDADQPLFITAGLLTRSDFDVRFGNEVKAIAASIGEEEIHATKLGVGRIEGIAHAVLKVVRKAGPAFFLARVEKRFVLAGKIYDTIFDSGENRAVPWTYYNLRPLRMMMVFKIADILDDALAESFWDALLEKGDERARTKMAGFCTALRARTHMIGDARSREVADDGLDWAVDNPEALRFTEADKVGRKGHMPNMIGFGNLLAGIERQSDVWRRPVEVIRHDRQHEFEPAIRFWHGMFAGARVDAVTLPLGERVVLRKVFGSRLEISSAKASAGIQVIDVILWLFARALRGDALPRDCQALLNYVYSRARQDDFSFKGVGASVEEQIEAMDDDVLSSDEMRRVLAAHNEIEAGRKAAMAEYARAKAAVAAPPLKAVTRIQA